MYYIRISQIPVTLKSFVHILALYNLHCLTEKEAIFYFVQVCEEESVQIEVFCLAVNCVDRSPSLLGQNHPYPILSFHHHHHLILSVHFHLFFVPAFSCLQVLGRRPLETEPVATLGQRLPHGRLEGQNLHHRLKSLKFLCHLCLVA